MKNKIFKFLAVALPAIFFIYVIFVSIPRKYDVPAMQKRTGTLFWDLSTGSKIGYTLVPAQGLKKSSPVIFLQGGPGGFISERNILMLSPLSEDGYDIYLYDQVGSGQSERLKDISEYTADRHKRDLEEIVKKTGAEKVIFIAQSWGGVLATLFTADNPGKVEKIIFTGTGPIQPRRDELTSILPPDSIHLQKPPYTNRQANEKTGNLRMGAISYCARNFGIKIADDAEADDFQTYLNSELNKATVCDTSHALKTQGGGGYYVQIMTVNSFEGTVDPRPKLKNSKIPVLILKGQCDSQPWGFITEYLELFPDHQLKIIPGAGHNISVEQPEIYKLMIKNFLNQ